MALKGCFGLLKCLVWVVNLIFWLAGIAILAFSLWLLFDTSLYLKVAEDANSYLKGTYFLLAAGGLMTLVGFLGCCGAFRESQCMLTTYFLFVLVILVAQISAAAWAYVNRAELNKLIKDGVKDTVRKTYTRDQARTAAFDGIQQALKCCGAEGPSDWATSVYNNPEDRSVLDIGIQGVTKGFRVPKSCCKDMESVTCEASAQMSLMGSVVGRIFDNVGIHTEGCSDKLVDLIEKHSIIVIWTVVGLGVIELLGMICSLLLCCAVRRIDDFKA